MHSVSFGIELENWDVFVALSKTVAQFTYHHLTLIRINLSGAFYLLYFMTLFAFHCSLSPDARSFNMEHLHSAMDVTSIAFGFTIGFFICTGMTISHQVIVMYKRTGRIWNPYPWMCTIELLVNLIIAITSWLYLRGDIARSFEFVFFTFVLWTIQTQLIVQIIANRIAIVLADPRQGIRLKWALFVAVGLVNVSVCCIWIPAQLRISERWVYLNEIWDRAEKGIYLCIDLLLNIYFVYVVRSRLITNGLHKYKSLFNFNVIIVFVSVSMDVLIIGIMFLPNRYIYVQFHPVAYIVKLNIECSMADLISKIARGKERSDNFHSKCRPNPAGHASHTCPAHADQTDSSGVHSNSHHQPRAEKPDCNEVASEKKEEPEHNRIMKTVTTSMVSGENKDKTGKNSVSGSIV